MSIIQILKQYIKHRTAMPMQNFVVAYSGGVDSHVLLHAMAQLRSELGFELQAIHIHHGLSAHADAWQAHCQMVCEALNITFYTANVNVLNISQNSLEALARKARYTKLVELAPDQSTLLLAQHQDDQLETFLLQLKRGAGPKGLSAMNQAWQVTDKEQGKTLNFYRPLLEVSQQAVLEYAQQHRLSWCEDESNQNTDFERNFLRHQILPALQERWPELAKSVSRSAALCSQQQDLLEEVCAEKLVKLQAKDNSLHIVGLNELSTHWLHQVVRYWLSTQGIQSPSLAVIERLQPEVLNAADDANPILQWQGWQFRRFNQQLYVIVVQDKVEPISIRWIGQEQVVLPQSLGALKFDSKDCLDDKGVRFNSTDGDVTVSLGSYSKRFTPLDSLHSKPLKQWFKFWKIPSWKRDCVVQLVQNDRVIALLMEGGWIVASGGVEITDQAVSDTVTVSYLP